METIISGMAFGFCAVVMIGIGVYQYRSKEPVGFYTGVEPPKAEELTDVEGWNREHGKMWIIYGVVFILSWLVGLLFKESTLILIPYSMGLFVPPLVIVIRHGKLKRRYMK
ncbi:MAG: hypothetical protein MJ146_02675 [Clostridia bacterium]|nr:hypothetical protein [Clostridia bacterium]